MFTTTSTYSCYLISLLGYKHNAAITITISFFVFTVYHNDKKKHRDELPKKITLFSPKAYRKLKKPTCVPPWVVRRRH